VLTAEIQQIERAGRVGIEIDPGIFHRAPHAGPRRQVDDGVKGHRSFKQRSHLLPPGDVELVEVEVGTLGDLRQPPLLQPHVIGVAEVVDADHGVSVIQQKLRDLRRDKPGNSSDEIVAHKAPLYGK